MKLLSFIIFFTYYQCFGQCWNEHINTQASEYPYEYTFMFQNYDDSSSYVYTKMPGDSLSYIYIKDNKGEEIIGANIILRNKITDSISNFVTNIDGFIKLNLKQGEYVLEIFMMHYDKFEIEISIIENEHINFEIFLGRGPEDDLYLIKSKTKLPEEEINDIIHCVKEHRYSFSDECSKLDEYYVVMQI